MLERYATTLFYLSALCVILTAVGQDDNDMSLTQYLAWSCLLTLDTLLYLLHSVAYLVEVANQSEVLLNHYLARVVS